MLFRDRTGPGGGPERYRLVEATLGWQPWSQSPGGPPADLAVAFGGTGSVYRLARPGVPVFTSGESTEGVDLGLARRIGWLRLDTGLRWGHRWFKFRRVRLDYLNAAAGASLRLPWDAAWIGPFAETLPALANPDRLPVPWSAGVAGGAAGAQVALFATNTYGSAAPVTAVGLRETVWGVRAAWDFGDGEGAKE